MRVSQENLWRDSRAPITGVKPTGKSEEQRKAWAHEAINEETFLMQAITARLTALHMASA